ncbi:MAG: rRNA maturation RNase YbeY [Thermodesulfobacteriales bacterium]|nr:MAG: rRNA maturation RNase YbeY [Thermodesulfobacteriales bacterium]
MERVSKLVFVNIAILDETGEIKSDYKKSLKKIARLVLKELDVPKDTELSITFTDDIQMRELNRSYRQIDRTTDVLSFPQSEGPDFTLLGDIVISIDTAARHSVSYGVTMHDELKKLIIHGILHLLGHNHKKKKETQIMRGKEKELSLIVEDL